MLPVDVEGDGGRAEQQAGHRPGPSNHSLTWALTVCVLTLWALYTTTFACCSSRPRITPHLPELGGLRRFCIRVDRRLAGLRGVFRLADLSHGPPRRPVLIPFTELMGGTIIQDEISVARIARTFRPPHSSGDARGPWHQTGGACGPGPRGLWKWRPPRRSGGASSLPRLRTRTRPPRTGTGPGSGSRSRRAWPGPRRDRVRRWGTVAARATKAGRGLLEETLLTGNVKMPQSSCSHGHLPHRLHGARPAAVSGLVVVDRVFEEQLADPRTQRHGALRDALEDPRPGRGVQLCGQFQNRNVVYLSIWGHTPVDLDTTPVPRLEIQLLAAGLARALTGPWPAWTSSRSRTSRTGTPSPSRRSVSL